MEPRWNYRVRKFLGRLHRMSVPAADGVRLGQHGPFGGPLCERNLWPKLPQPNFFRLCAVILSQPVATLPLSVEQATSAT